MNHRNALLAQLFRREENFEETLVLTKAWFVDYPDNKTAKTEYAFALTAIRGELSALENSSDSVRLLNLARQMLRDIVTDEAGNYVTTDWKIMSHELILADSIGDRESAQTMAKLILKRYESQPYRRTGTSIYAALAHTILGNRDAAIRKVRS